MTDATNVNQENEQLDELNKSTVGSYVNKASNDATLHSFKAGKGDMKAASKATQRIRGIANAVKKMQKEEATEVTTEDESNLDEAASVAAATLKPNSRPVSKAEAVTSVVHMMNSMSKEDMSKWFDQAMALIGKEASSLPAGANYASNQGSVDMTSGSGSKTRDPMPKLNVKEDIDQMYAGEELSEEFKDKAATLFEAAVSARVAVELTALEENFEEKFETELSEAIEAIEIGLDNYLDYAVSKWLEENEVAIETALRNELTEEFISGLKNLFAEHYIDVPEEKVDAIEALAAKIEDLEESLNAAIEQNTQLKAVVEESTKHEAVAAVAEGLTMTQAEKFYALAEGIEFDGNVEAYAKKLNLVKEQYFVKTSTRTLIEEETFEGDIAAHNNVSIDPGVAKYAQAISKTVKK